MSVVIVWLLLRELENKYSIKLRIPSIHSCLYIMQEVMHMPLSYKFNFFGGGVEAYLDNDQIFGSTLNILVSSWIVIEPNDKGAFILFNDSARFIVNNQRHVDAIADIDIRKVVELGQMIYAIGDLNLGYFAVCHYQLCKGAEPESLLHIAQNDLPEANRKAIVELVVECITKYPAATI